ncbi:hypothetical protein VVD49_20970 [Uliginosibacterium sp. H3]|uniref:Uncharacterized protein n=1 Tax=Uliginosibacterium silvisoli TaxID=3114758 RepID=A0ABU6KA92_9RHOO|nr:hypothetical protein [Uliginosibacterium sp. H3]
MKLRIKALLLGLGASLFATAMLVFTLPFLFFSLSIETELWLLWLPCLVLPPALMLGGFVAARFFPHGKFLTGALTGSLSASFLLIFIQPAAMTADGVVGLPFALLVYSAIVFGGALFGILGAWHLRRDSPVPEK